jgi:uncharacterized membrane protein
MHKRWTFASGAAAGAGLALLLDPQRGGRRRALMRDKIVRAAHKGADAVDTTVRDLSQRAQGVAAEARGRLRSEVVPDAVLEARVRAKLGRVVSHPRAIDVAARDGCVTVEGPILAREAGKLLDVVRRTRGVCDVVDRLEVHERPDDIPSLQGGATRQGARSEVMQQNWAPTTRLLAGAAGGALIAYGVRQGRPIGWTLLALGTTLAARGAANLPLSRLTGAGAGRRALDIQKTIHVAAPVSDVFAFWSDYVNFPRFMANVREVRAISREGQSHWVVNGPAGMPIEFDTVVTAFRANELIAWRTVEGSPVAHAGIVRFEPTPDAGTRVHIRLSYNPPGGAVGAAVAWLTGADPKTQLDEDLVRMKTFIETGRPPRDAAEPRATATPGMDGSRPPTREPALRD